MTDLWQIIWGLFAKRLTNMPKGIYNHKGLKHSGQFKKGHKDLGGGFKKGCIPSMEE